MTPLSWEQIYEGWKPNDLKYYWKRTSHKVIKRYMGYVEKRFAEAFELGRRRDERALTHLRRVIESNPESADAKAALAVLNEAGVHL